MTVMILLGEQDACKTCDPEIYCCDFKWPKNCPLRDYDSKGRRKPKRFRKLGEAEDHE